MDRHYFDRLYTDDSTACGIPVGKLSENAGDFTSDPDNVTCLLCLAGLLQEFGEPAREPQSKEGQMSEAKAPTEVEQTAEPSTEGGTIPEPVAPVVPTPEEISAALSELATTRYRGALAAAEVASLKADFAAKNAEAIANADRLKEAAAIQEAAVKAMVLVRYEATKADDPKGAKKPTAGCEVKVGKVTTYPVPAALAFCIERKLDQYVIPPQLNTSAFASVATSLIPHLCTTTDDPKVTVTRDLDLALGIDRVMTDEAAATASADVAQ